MLGDIQTTWDVLNHRGDWTVQSGALASGNDLTTAVLISLFTDRRALPSDIIPDGSTDPRGWWADQQVDGNIDEIGSRLWLLDRSKAPTQAILNQAVGYCNEALAWMVSDGVAAKVTVQASWQDVNFLALFVTIYKVDGTQQSLKFTELWKQVS